MSSIQAISPNFQGNILNKTTNYVKDVYADPTDCHNSEAVASGAIATAGVSGAAAVAGRMKAMRNTIASAQNFTSRAVGMKAKNVSILNDFVQNFKQFLKNTKATSWIANAMATPFGKKVVGGTVAVAALGITAAQLFSAADMACGAIEYYN